MNRRLQRALLRRELGLPLLGGAIILLIGSLALGRLIAERGVPLPTGDDSFPPMVMSGDRIALWIASHVTPLPFVMAAAVLALGRLAGDRSASWLSTLVAAGASRGGYAGAVLAAVVLGQSALLGSVIVGLHVGVWTISGGGASLLRHAVADAPGMIALIISSAVYGAAWAALVRRRDLAIWFAIVGVAYRWAWRPGS